ncbi:MAG: hypothetical protein IIA81_05940 [Thaumarchaeota archaeon]|nr:hypothetical protein [Nitrososphaerota archaeon]
MIIIPKIIPYDLKFKVISLFYLGYSRDEIAEKLGLGKGTVSKYLDEFREEIGIPAFEAIKGWGRFLNKNQIDHKDAIKGIRIGKLLERFDIKEDELNSVFEKAGAILSGENEVGELLISTNQLLEIKRKTGNSYQKTVSEYEKLSQEIPVLKNNKKNLESMVEQLCKDRDKALKLHETTEEELHQFTAIKSQYEKIGLTLTELPKYQDALVEIKRQGYDATKLLNYLQQVGNLEKQIETSKKVLADYDNEIQNVKKDLKSVLEELRQSKLEYKQFLEAVKIILEFRRNQQDPTTVIQWNKILQQNDLSVVQFDKKLRNYNGLLEYLRKLKEKILSSEQQKDALQMTVTDLKNEKQDLITLIGKAEIELEDKIKHAKKEIEQLEATNPLRLIYQSKGESQKVLPMLVIFFKQLRIWFEAHKIKDFTILHSIDDLIKEIERMLKING